MQSAPDHSDLRDLREFKTLLPVTGQYVTCFHSLAGVANSCVQ
jgi:hypothetical protein